MQENQNAFQNAGQHGYFNYQSIGNQTSTGIVLILALMMFLALLRSEERYRKLVKSMRQASNDHS